MTRIGLDHLKKAPTNEKKFLIQGRAHVKGQTQGSTKKDIVEI